MNRALDGVLSLTRRDDRWLALGARQIAFAADGEGEWARLCAEARLIERWRDAGVPVPRILATDEHDRVQVRERLDGIMGEIVEPLLFGSATLADLHRISPFAPAGQPLPWPLPDGPARLAGACPLSPFGVRLATSYGQLCARMHAALDLETGARLGLAARAPMDLDAAFARLRATAIDRALVAKAQAQRAWIADGPAPTCVVHGDLHFHNMCLAEDGSIIGVFDVGDAHLDGPASEFHYIHSLGPRFVATAITAYGAALDEDAIRRAHVRTALGHLEWVGPDSPRYPAIISWVTAVVASLVPGNPAGT